MATQKVRLSDSMCNTTKKTDTLTIETNTYKSRVIQKFWH